MEYCKCNVCTGKCTCRICQISAEIHHCMSDSRQQKAFDVLWENWESDSNDKVFALQKVEELKIKVAKLEKIIASQRHELALQDKYRKEDQYARQMLDKNACQRRVEELETKLTETET
jgi:uncharacterized Zn finger protein (UPF0148 family)